MTHCLGVNQYDRTYMERIGREGSLRTPDRKLAQRLKRRTGEGVRHHAAYFDVRTGRFLCEELRFPREFWEQVAEVAGLSGQARTPRESPERRQESTTPSCAPA